MVVRIVMWLILITSSTPATLAASPSVEVAALWSLCSATNCASWKQPWNTNDTSSACGWGEGILCNGGEVVQLELFQRDVSGTLPAQLADLDQLAVFNVSGNKLSGTLPVEYGAGWSSTLIVFAVSSNSITGTIPTSYSSWKNISAVDMSNNRLSGTLPANFSQWGSTLIFFTVKLNQLSGSLPQSYGAQWTSCQIFLAASNNLSGTLPSEYAMMYQMWIFTARENNISGTLPVAYATGYSNNNNETTTTPSGWKNIISFDVGVNNLSGTIPSEYGEHWRIIGAFGVEKNQLTGTIPESLRLWNLLQKFSVDENRLNGTLSSNYRNWTNLDSFNARSNLLTGSLPVSYLSWQVLTVFEVSGNSLSGTLPAQYGAWTKMKTLGLRSNMFQGTIPSYWAQQMQSLQFLDVSHNVRLEGTIPYGFFSGGSFRILLLSNNSLSGTIPYSATDGVNSLIVQDNPRITGEIRTLSSVVVVAACNTSLCSSIGTTGCLSPNYAMASLDGMDYFAAAQILTNATTLSPMRVCGAPTPPPTLRATKTPLIPNNNDNEMPPAEEVAALQTTAGVAVVNSVVSLASVDAADAQMLMSILSSPCMCSAVRVASSPTIMGLASSPFAPLGSDAWVVVGNVALCLLLIALHCGALHVVTIRGLWPSVATDRKPATVSAAADAPQRGSGSYYLRRWLECSWYNPAAVRAAMVRLQFPNFSAKFILLLTPGVIKSVSALANRAEDSGLSVTSMVVGAGFVAALTCVLEFVVFRFTTDNMTNNRKNDRQTRRKHSSSVSTILRLTFEHYHLQRTFPTVSRNLAKFALPRGAWKKDDDRKSYGLLVSSWMKGSERFWMLMPTLNLVVQILSAGSSDEDEESSSGGDASATTCDAIQSITIVLLLCTMSLILVRLPYRSLLSSYFAALGLVLTSLTVLLGLLCRHDVVDSSSVSSFSVFVSCLMAVSKVYSLVLPFAETRLQKKPSVATQPQGADLQQQEEEQQSSLIHSISDAIEMEVTHVRSGPQQQQQHVVDQHALLRLVQQRRSPIRHASTSSYAQQHRLVLPTPMTLDTDSSRMTLSPMTSVVIHSDRRSPLTHEEERATPTTPAAVAARSCRRDAEHLDGRSSSAAAAMASPLLGASDAPNNNNMSFARSFTSGSFVNGAPRMPSTTAGSFFPASSMTIGNAAAMPSLASSGPLQAFGCGSFHAISEVSKPMMKASLGKANLPADNLTERAPGHEVRTALKELIELICCRGESLL